MKVAGLMLVFCLASLGFLPRAAALERTNTIFKVFQFPPDKIPTIDGKTNDWDIVPKDYVIGIDQLADDSGKHRKADPKNLDVQVRVGWVKGLNRLYFLYEAYKAYWDFADPGLHNDTFEVVVDGDLSGGPLIERFLPARDILGPWETYYSLQGTQAQNYHIFTPAEGKDWCMVWGPAHWLKELPYANAAYSYHFRPGEPGRLVLEFWITPFDYAAPKGRHERWNRSCARTRSSASAGQSLNTTTSIRGRQTTASGTSRPNTPCTATLRNWSPSS